MALRYDQWFCGVCGLTNAEKPGVDTHYSLGIYAGRYHPECWKKSGYRDEPASGFDPSDAGESYEEI